MTPRSSGQGRGSSWFARERGTATGTSCLPRPRDPSGGFQPFLVTLTEESEAFPLFQHSGTEFLYALSGRLTYRFGQQTYDMEPGDSLLFDGAVPHGPEALADLPIRFLSITIDLPAGDDAPNLAEN